LRADVKTRKKCPTTPDCQRTTGGGGLFWDRPGHAAKKEAKYREIERSESKTGKSRSKGLMNYGSQENKPGHFKWCAQILMWRRDSGEGSTGQLFDIRKRSREGDYVEKQRAATWAEKDQEIRPTIITIPKNLQVMTSRWEYVSKQQQHLGPRAKASQMPPPPRARIPGNGWSNKEWVKGAQ